MKRFLTVLLIFLALVLQTLGGYMDMTDKKSIGYFTQKHAWTDAMFLLVLAIAINVVK